MLVVLFGLLAVGLHSTDGLCIDYAVGASDSPEYYLQFTMSSDGNSLNDYLANSAIYLRSDGSNGYATTGCSLEDWGSFACLPDTGEAWTVPLDMMIIFNTSDQYDGMPITFDDAIPDLTESASSSVCIPDATDFLCAQFTTGDNGGEYWFFFEFKVDDAFYNDYIYTNDTYIRSHGRDDWPEDACTIPTWSTTGVQCTPGSYGAWAEPLDVRIMLNNDTGLDGRTVIFEQVFTNTTVTGNGEFVCAELPIDVGSTTTVEPTTTVEDSLCSKVSVMSGSNANWIQLEFKVAGEYFTDYIDVSTMYLRDTGTEEWYSEIACSTPTWNANGFVCEPGEGEQYDVPLDIKFMLDTATMNDTLSDYDGTVLILESAVESLSPSSNFVCSSLVPETSSVFDDTGTSVEPDETEDITTTEDSGGVQVGMNLLFTCLLMMLSCMIML